MAAMTAALNANVSAAALLPAALRARLPAFEPGCVWLAGAGPGDPGLLTLLATAALVEADVILHDALISDEILALARPDAALENVGKRAGRPSPKQEEINARLIELAHAGRRVLRLKGGDPFVFGRGGEECLALAGAGVAFRVVPGVSAGVGGLAYAGIPVTHRGLATSMTFVTGSDKTGALPAEIDWPALGRAPGSLVFFMALGALEAISQRLIAAGKSPTTPVAVISSASTPDQKVIETTLARAARDARRLGARRPAIIAVGEVVQLRAAFGDLLLNRGIEAPEPVHRIAV